MTLTPGEINWMLLVFLYLSLAFTLDLALDCWQHGYGWRWFGLVVYESLSIILAFLIALMMIVNRAIG